MMLILVLSMCTTLFKVKLAPHRHIKGIRLILLLGTLTTSITNGSNIELGRMRFEQWKLMAVWTSWQTNLFSIRIHWIRLGDLHRIHIDKCIIYNTIIYSIWIRSSKHITVWSKFNSIFFFYLDITYNSLILIYNVVQTMDDKTNNTPCTTRHTGHTWQEPWTSVKTWYDEC